jgi:hypothetical protein
MRLPCVILVLTVLTLTGCAESQGVPLPLNGKLSGPCTPALVVANWRF